MRYAIISDIHSNIQALNTALKVLETKDIDEIVCLGDIVGYNANPSECIKVIRDHPKIKNIIKGNHDDFSSRMLSFSESLSISQQAALGIKYSFEHISQKDKEWLQNLNTYYKEVKSNGFKFAIAHSCPMINRGGDFWSYVLNEYDAKVNIDWWVNWDKKSKPNLCFFGHSHYPTYVEFDKKGNNITFEMGKNLDGNTYVIKKNMNYFINCGSIGQPRSDGITSYGIVDTKERTVKIESFEYDFSLARKAVREAGYSGEIADRLDPNYKKNDGE